MDQLQNLHGSGNRQARIEARAKAIIYGAWWATESDSTDINPDEVEEIAAAEKLVAKWEAM